jgi:hypothetical protein
MKHWISTSAAALVIGSALAFPVGPAAAQKATKEVAPAQFNSDQGGRGQVRGAAAESRGRQSMTESRGGTRANTGMRGEASFRDRGAVTTSRISRDNTTMSRTSRDNTTMSRTSRDLDNRRLVQRDRGFVDRDRSFVDHDVRGRSFATYGDRRLNRRYVRGGTYAADGTDAIYVRGGARPFAYGSYDDEPTLYRAYGDTGYSYGPRTYDNYAYDGPVYGGGLFAYGGDTYMDNSLYLNADDDTTYSPVLNRAPCTCATYR